MRLKKLGVKRKELLIQEKDAYRQRANEALLLTSSAMAGEKAGGNLLKREMLAVTRNGEAQCLERKKDRLIEA
jgi:hypothetical protein